MWGAYYLSTNWVGGALEEENIPIQFVINPVHYGVIDDKFHFLQ